MRQVRRILGLTFGWIAIALCLSANAHATTLARLNLDQLTAAADAVARVRCVGTESRWDHGEIWTFSTFEVLEQMQGALASQVTVRLPGGRVGHITAAVEGTPRFSPGAETVLFLQQIGASEFSVAGWVQGTFRIAQDHAGNQTVTQDSSTFAVFDTLSRTFRTEGIRAMPIEEFRQRVAQARSRKEGRVR